MPNPTGFIMKKRTRTISKKNVVKVSYSNHYCGEIQARGHKVSTDTGPVLVTIFIVFENLYLNMIIEGHPCTPRVLTSLRPHALTTVNGTYFLCESTILAFGLRIMFTSLFSPDVFIVAYSQKYM